MSLLLSLSGLFIPDRKNGIKIIIAGFILCGLTGGKVSADSSFEESYLRRDKNGASPDVFIYKNAVTPGIKSVDIRVNDQSAGKMDVEFISNGRDETTPCLSADMLKTIGIKTELYEEKANGRCYDLKKTIPASELYYRDSNQTLFITVPQEAVDKQNFTMIPPEEWDHGVTSLRTSYNGYYYSSRIKTDQHSGGGNDSDSDTSRSAYVNLNTVGSLGAWRLYSVDSFYKSDQRGWESNHDRSYLSRDIASLRSQLQVGEIYTRTSGYMAGTVPLSGVSLTTSEKMSLDNQFRFAPVIRGVARTNARLTVRQRGNVIYSTTLTPGPFAIDDLYSAQVGADLEATVEESDGQRQVFRVPYTSLPDMIRPGAMRYSVAAGKYRSQGRDVKEPVVFSGGLERGFEYFTLGGALLASDRYQTLSAGVSWNAGNIGAFSAEIAHARYSNPENSDNTRDGSAVRVQYARHFEASDTSLQILGYQYRSEDFLEFQEYLMRDSGYVSPDDDDAYAYSTRRKRNRLEMTINQNVTDIGSLYMTVSQDRYYGTSNKSTSVTGGVGTTIGSSTVSLSLTDTRDEDRSDRQLSLSVSIPLSSGSDSRRSYGSLNYGLVRDQNKQFSQSLGYSGSALDNTLTYSANVLRDVQGKYSQSGTLGYNGSMANISGGLSHSNNYNQISAGMSGGVTLYGGGVVLSPVLGDTVAIVDTTGASGIGLSGSGDVRTDMFGHAMVTWLTPYRYNEINLDASGVDNVELKETGRKVVPSEGAAVLLKFASRVGRRAMAELHGPRNIPLGAMVYTEGDGASREEAGIVGNKGLTYLSGLDARNEEHLLVVWGDGPDAQCRFTLPAATPEQLKPDNWYQKIIVNCR
ncbi:TPA: fimbrial biogenesis outer membrane usher protein [Citrobacter farmeri]|uniref:fimbria/pilus outer membrane usher protein n=1 Tax=Citrobacter farmeri TaxID=67824 RepID=UPI00229FF375|nr:fimbria/pilus outer membrane usher protein [Citrobacter farmeri]MEC3931385.1 fimbria/pilus outer membrane usher protein [Citrobacter farmeri]HCW7014806.1 fimbrial biogenesis outer membrane usher protein [Citrobacter farmeri]